jgi:hypothetical protein
VKKEFQSPVLDLDELVLLNNCLNEVCNGVHIDDWEFQTRIGSPRSSVRSLLDKIHASIPKDAF